MKLLNTIIWGILKISLLIAAAFILVIIINSVIRGDKLDPNDPRPPSHLYNYWHPSWDENNPRTIIPDGEGTIEYEDGTVDSIRWNESDEYRMWITGEGDTIWE
jgi:hypothetical protein